MTTPETRHERGLKAFGGEAALAAVDDYVNRVADNAPPLTAWQKGRLHILLRNPAADSTQPASLNADAA